MYEKTKREMFVMIMPKKNINASVGPQGERAVVGPEWKGSGKRKYHPGPNPVATDNHTR